MVVSSYVGWDVKPYSSHLLIWLYVAVVVVVVVVVVDLYSAPRRASNALIVPLRRKKDAFFYADLKSSLLQAGSGSECGSEFHSIGPATEKPECMF